MIEKGDLVELFSFETSYLGFLEQIIYSSKNSEEISEIVLWVPTWWNDLEKIGFTRCTDFKKIDLEYLKHYSWRDSVVAEWFQKLTPAQGLTSPYPIVRDWARNNLRNNPVLFSLG